jgi:hypothetical protein
MWLFFELSAVKSLTANFAEECAEFAGLPLTPRKVFS